LSDQGYIVFRNTELLSPFAPTEAVADFGLDALAVITNAPPTPTYKVSGHGTYLVGGEVAVVQEMFLEVLIDNGVTNKLCYLTNDTSVVERLWPMIKIRTSGTYASL
jgi:hypothetical protein